MLATAVSSWYGYQRVRAALEHEFESRLEHMAAAVPVTPEHIADIHRRFDESNSYLDAQTHLSTLLASAGIENASLLDSARTTLIDARGDTVEFERSPLEFERSELDRLAGPALTRALAGDSTVSAPYRRGGRVFRVGFAPVRAPSGRVAGVVAVEAEAAYLPVLLRLRRTLIGLAVATMIAVGFLAALLIRGARAAAELERRLSRAENLAAMGRLTATLAHEIKNPLAIIRGSAERLATRDAEAQRMASFVIEESDRLSKTVARYLQFARGAPEAVREPGDAVAALEATLDLLEGEFRARGVLLERAGPIPDPAPVALDSESLKQLYLNLILNALEAMESEGRLRVAAGERGGRIEVSIADTGPGMSPEVLRRVGSPFYTTKAGGSGLGLFLARRLAQAAGGALEIESDPKLGTTCRVRLPRGRG